jgi:hypothetical protein
MLNQNEYGINGGGSLSEYPTGSNNDIDPDQILEEEGLLDIGAKPLINNSAETQPKEPDYS